MTTRRGFTVGWLYPDLMNIYGDRGNILTLLRRAEWRGFRARVLELPKGTVEGMDDVDVFFFGGGQDREQALVYDDLLEFKALPLGRAVAEGAAMLAVCGGYQLLGHYYQTAEGDRFPGIGLLDLHTEAGPTRHIGNVVVDTSLGLNPPTLVGFENHSGRTYLSDGLKPLGRVRVGAGNNGQDGTEGVVEQTVFGTYLHGSLLPKNPQLADLIIGTALRRRGISDLEPLDDRLELDAHRRVLDRELAARR
ncbi:MAG TPA: glutamine amidotransferase [Candidatus Dormibacteraeota bacterium]